jgi:adenosine deaminase
VTALLPKAEIHVHLEGTAPPGLVRRLAARNGVRLPDGLFGPDGAFAWTDFLGFLRAYDAAAEAIRTAEDYRDVTREYLASCAAEGAVYVEAMVSPDHAAAAGLSYAGMVEGVAAGIADARAATGIEARMVVVCVRHLGAERAEAVARMAARRPHPLATGFGMAGNEAYGRPADFARAFRIARDEAGLACTAHAGEVMGAGSVRAVLDALPVSRIGHGVRAVEDPDLVRELADRGIPLEVCPGSNVATGVYASRAAHPLRSLVDAGCAVTLNSDDPPYFGTSVGAEYAAAATEHGLSEDELRTATRTALRAAFVDDETRARLLARAG